MKRIRLETTNYGGPDGPESPDPLPIESAEPQRGGRNDRLTVRRNMLSRPLVLDAKALFERRLGRTVSENEARNLLGNLADFGWMLVQWEISPPPPPTLMPSAKRGRPRKEGRARS